MVGRKRNVSNCRHAYAYPTVFGAAGYMWCPDCGAIRMIVNCGENEFKFVHNRWLYPTGHQDVLEQLESMHRDTP